MTEKLNNSVVNEAKNGGSKALEKLINHIQDSVHRLSIRMVLDPNQAMDATQEILILVITKLSTFEFKSSFETWVYRVAVNYLLTARKAASKHAGLTFDVFALDLENGLIDDNIVSAEDHLLLNELRITCTMAMLLCLDKHHRMAYILGEILEFDQAEAIEVLDISKNSYRKRLSRARKEVIAFTSKSCGLASKNAQCRCSKRLPQALNLGRIPTQPNLLFNDAPTYKQIRNEALRTEAALVASKLQRATGALRSPRDMAEIVMHILEPPR